MEKPRRVASLGGPTTRHISQTRNCEIRYRFYARSRYDLAAMSRHAAFLVVFLAASAATPSVARAAKLWEREWREIRTEHFVIASALSENRSVELAADLENFRFVARKLISQGAADAFEERIPTKVYVLPQAVPDLGVDGSRVGGYLSPGLRANYAVIMEVGDDSAAALKHEYVHFLLHNHGAQLYPPWFDEGTAEVLSTLTVRNGIVEYGKPLKDRIEVLTNSFWMAYPKLLSYRDTASVDRGLLWSYYAQSWLLMQYLMIGREGHSFSAEAGDFLRRSENGEPELEAFKTAFGLDPRDLEHTLRTYGRRMRYFRSQGPVTLPLVQPLIRRLPVDGIAAELGLLALIHGNFDASERYYAAALAANSNNAIALAGMGDVHWHAKRFEDAERCYAAAVAAEPRNANHELDWGEYFLHRAGAADSDPELRRSFLVEARKHFARSFAINPQNPETLDQNALTYLYDGEDPAKAVASLEAAYELLPSHAEIQANLALAYMKTGKPELARQILNRLLAWSHSGGEESIKKLIAELDANESNAEPATGRVAAEPRSLNE